MEDIKTDYLYFSITNIILFKTLIDVISKKTDGIRFRFKKNKKCHVLLEITSINLTRTYFTKCKINFIEKFICDEDTIQLEFDPINLLNILKTFDNLTKGKIEFIINSNNKEIMEVNFKEIINENKDIQTKKLKQIQVSTFRFNIFYPKYQEKEIIKVNHDKIIIMKAKIFHKICKDLELLFPNVKINSKNNKYLCLGYNLSGCEGLIRLKYESDESNKSDKSDKSDDKNNYVKLKDNNNKIITTKGIYNLEDIGIFSKLSEISTYFDIKIKDLKSMELTYKFDELCIFSVNYMSINDDTIKNYSNLLNFDQSESNSDNTSNYSEKSKDEDQNKLKKKTIDDKILWFEITQIDILKSICESIEKLTTYPIFKISCIDDLLYIEISCTNSSKTIMFNTKIKNIFGKFKKITKSIELGINLDYFNTLLKLGTKTSLMILSIDKQDKQNLIIQIKNDNTIKQTFKIKLINVEYEKNLILLDKLTNKIIIESNEFYRIAKEIGTIGGEFRIELGEKNMIFSSENDSKYINLIKNNNSIIETKFVNFTDNISCEYETKDIIIFSRMINYIDNFTLNINKQGTMIIDTQLCSNGFMKIQYQSKNKDEISYLDNDLLLSDVESMENKIIFFKLKNTNIMKTIIDTLDKISSEVIWTFYSENLTENLTENSMNLEMICTDPSKTLYVKTKLYSNLFKSFYSKSKMFRFCMNLENLNKILKLIEKDDIVIYCYIENSDPNNMVIRFKNLEKKNKKMFKIPLQIVQLTNPSQLSLSFEKKIVFECSNMFKKCKTTNINSHFVQIDCDGDKLEFSGIGINSTKTNSIELNKTNDSKLEIINLDDNHVKCIYETKNIMYFSKLTSITQNFSIYMKNNFALTMIFGLGLDGSITTMLSPVNDEYISNESYDYSDDEEEINLI